MLKIKRKMMVLMTS